MIRLAADRPAVQALLDRLAAQDHEAFVLLVALAYAFDQQSPSQATTGGAR